MKQIADTVTLSYLEEDNKQRVIFRVFPLCTKEGVAFLKGDQTFPDEGGLRIVPDKREQSTFKERMRAIGPLCAISLISDGKEVSKVRPNRNYAPDKGEVNQNAIYSDVVCSLGDDALFEVLTSTDGQVALNADNAPLTQRLLVEEGKVLYGPVDAQQLRDGMRVAELRPFGNDAFLLQTVELPDGTRHTVYWDPEQLQTWRQKKSEIKRLKAERSAEMGSQPDDAKKMPLEAAEAPSEQPAKAAERPVARPVAVSAPMAAVQTPVETSLPDADMEGEPIDEKADAATADAEEVMEALPIGAKLSILDESLAFEQQISQLSQPLSAKANLLSATVAEPEDEPELEGDEPPARFNGTPLVKMPGNGKSRGRDRQENMHHVVEQQLRSQRAVQPGADLTPDAPFQPVANPMENLQSALDQAWDHAEIHDQVVQLLQQNEELTTLYVRLMQKNGKELHVKAAARAQLEDIEAERLSLTMQLDKARNDAKEYEKQVVASLNKQKEEALAKLDRQIAALTRQKDALETEAMQRSEVLANHLREASEQGNAVLLSPLAGMDHEISEMSEAIRTQLSWQGFAITDDDAQNLLIQYALFDIVRLSAASVAEARVYAESALRALGLLGASALIQDDRMLAVAGWAENDRNQTPVTVLRTSMGAKPQMEGYKTIILTKAAAPCDEQRAIVCPCPTVPVPQMKTTLRAQSTAVETLKPTSLASLAKIAAEVQPLLGEGEKWFRALEQELAEAEIPVDAVVLQDMRRYVSVASRRMRGGFLGAADMAVSQWIVPSLIGRPEAMQKMAAVLTDLPRTLDMLGV